MKLSLRLLKHFVAVAEERHFGRAAERLHMTQPPLSQQMKRLEERLGVSLFERTTRSVQLTAAGEVLLAQGRQLLSDADNLVLSVHRAAKGKIGALVIGFVNTASYEVLPRTLSAYRAAAPDIDLTFKPMHSYLAIEELRAGRMDIAFVRPPESLLIDQGFDLTLASREPMYVALPQHHSLSRRKVIPLDALEGVPFVGYTQQDGRYFYELITALFAQHRVRPDIVYESVMPTMFAIVEAGMGVALVPRSAAHTRLKGLVYRPLRVKGKPVEALMYAARRVNDDRAIVQGFLAAVLGSYARQTKIDAPLN